MFFRSSARLLIAVTIFCVFLTLTACKAEELTEKKQTATDGLIVSTTQKETSPSPQNGTDAKSGGDSENVKIDTYIRLADGNTAINGKGVFFENNTVYITESGSYSVEGSLTDGKIHVNINEEDKKVKLYLNGADISCSTDAPIFIENSPDETVIILAEGSVNNLSDTAREIPDDENADYATAVIYAKDDLQIEGSGTLNIKASFNKGIFSKNDIDIRGGIINIESVDDGIRGKESVEISDGTLNITSGGDGIRTNETAEEDKGDIEITGGNITVNSNLDSIQSVADINISGGTFNLVSGGGSTGVSQNQGNDMGMPGGMGGKGDRGGRGGMFGMPGGMTPPDSSMEETSEEDTPSTKGIKADGEITVSGGTFNISSLDDSIHGINLNLEGGIFTLRSDDDGIHADEEVTVDGADIDIAYSYEGIEGTVINIEGGEISLTSSDDGFNAAGVTASAEAQPGGFGGMGGNPMQADYSCVINVSDGYILINSGGDGVDSNGNINQSGGTIIVFGPENNGNGALDYGGTYTISGGTLLATGSSGMAQSVTGDGIEVLAFNYSCMAGTLNAITDKSGNSLIGFLSPKQFGTVVFADGSLKKGESYNVYSDGSFDTEGTDGIYLEGKYSPGTLMGTLTLS